MAVGAITLYEKNAGVNEVCTNEGRNHGTMECQEGKKCPKKLMRADHANASQALTSDNDLVIVNNPIVDAATGSIRITCPTVIVIDLGECRLARSKN
jgi:hypothetical protein